MVPLPRRISGPVSVHAFDLPTAGGGAPNRLYVFGDEHFSYDHQCAACDPPGCASIAAFIERLVDAARAGGVKSLDVYMEIPYVGRPNRTQAVRHWDDRLRANAAPGRKLKDLVKRMVGESPHYIGIFSVLYRKFHSELYPAEGRHARPAAGAPPVRFHYCDARAEPNVQAMFRGEGDRAAGLWLLATRAGTPEGLRDLLHAFLFSRDFPADAARAIGADSSSPAADALRTRIVPAALSGTTHKVAKQFLSLPPGPARDAAERYLKERVEHVVGILRDAGLEVASGLLRRRLQAAAGSGANPMDAPLADFLGTLRNSTLLALAETVGVAMYLAVQLVIMDAYLLCRMLRFSTQPGGVSVVYAGDSHSMYYVDFLRRYAGLLPAVCRPRVRAGMARSKAEPTHERCVQLDACKNASKASRMRASKVQSQKVQMQ